MVSLSSFEKLKLNQEFSTTYKHGKKWHCDSVVVFYKESSKKKVGFTASKKVGNAVKRNLAKRRMRAIFFEIQENLKDGIYVFVAKERMAQMSHEALKKGFHWSLKRLDCFK